MRYPRCPSAPVLLTTLFAGALLTDTAAAQAGASTPGGPARAEYALYFGGGHSRLPTFQCWLDQWWRIALDVRPDRLPAAGAYRLFGQARDRYQEPSLYLRPDGSLVFEGAGFVDGELDTWTLASPPGTVRAGVWQRVEVAYDEIRLQLYADGLLLAETLYPDSGLLHGRFTALAPAFEGALDDVRCGTYSLSEAFTDARFNEGTGASTYVGGAIPYTAPIERPSWVRRTPAGPRVADRAP